MVKLELLYNCGTCIHIFLKLFHVNVVNLICSNSLYILHKYKYLKYERKIFLCHFKTRFNLEVLEKLKFEKVEFPACEAILKLVIIQIMMLPIIQPFLFHLLK